MKTIQKFYTCLKSIKFAHDKSKNKQYIYHGLDYMIKFNENVRNISKELMNIKHKQMTIVLFEESKNLNYRKIVKCITCAIKN